MATTFTSLHVHLVFSTKNREPWLTAEIESRVWTYLGGIATENGIQPIQIGGYTDHIHALVGLPATLSVSRAAQLLKTGSSSWIHETFPKLRAFAWQDGYGAFAVSRSRLDAVAKYIRDQPEHHRTLTFAEEYRALLKRHGIAFDERYMLG